MLFNTRRYRKDIRVENDVGRFEADLLGQDLVRTLTDLDFALDRIRLALFVERHDDHGRTISSNEPRVLDEGLFALFKTDRVDDRLALHALKACLDHGPFRRIDHDRQSGNVRLGGDQV